MPGPNPTYFRARRSTLESHIGRCIARQDYYGEGALRYFANSVGVRLNEANVKAHADNYRHMFQEMENEDKLKQISQPQ